MFGIADQRHRLAVGSAGDGVVPSVEIPRPVVAREVVARLVVGIDEGLGHGDVEVLAGAGVLPLIERGQHRGHRDEPGVEVTVLVDLLERLGLPETRGQLDGARHGVHHGGVGPAMGPRPGLAEPGDGAEHQPGVAGRQLLIRQPVTGHDAGSVVLQQHVGPVGQRGHQLGGTLGLEVDTDVALARVHVAERDPDAVGVHRRDRPGEVARGGLDLDDVGPQVGQHPSAYRSGENPGEVHHPDAVERPLAHCRLLAEDAAGPDLPPLGQPIGPGTIAIDSVGAIGSVGLPVGVAVADEVVGHRIFGVHYLHHAGAVGGDDVVGGELHLAESTGLLGGLEAVDVDRLVEAGRVQILASGSDHLDHQIGRPVADQAAEAGEGPDCLIVGQELLDGRLRSIFNRWHLGHGVAAFQGLAQVGAGPGEAGHIRQIVGHRALISRCSDGRFEGDGSSEISGQDHQIGVVLQHRVHKPGGIGDAARGLGGHEVVERQLAGPQILVQRVAGAAGVVIAVEDADLDVLGAEEVVPDVLDRHQRIGALDSEGEAAQATVEAEAPVVGSAESGHESPAGERHLVLVQVVGGLGKRDRRGHHDAEDLVVLHHAPGPLEVGLRIAAIIHVLHEFDLPTAGQFAVAVGPTESGIDAVGESPVEGILGHRPQAHGVVTHTPGGGLKVDFVGVGPISAGGRHLLVVVHGLLVVHVLLVIHRLGVVHGLLVVHRLGVVHGLLVVHRLGVVHGLLGGSRRGVLGRGVIVVVATGGNHQRKCSQKREKLVQQ